MASVTTENAVRQTAKQHTDTSPIWLRAAATVLVPLVADGLVQMCTAYESRNYRRLWTGILFGYGLTALFFLSTAWVFHQGRLLGLSWKSGL